MFKKSQLTYYFLIPIFFLGKIDAQNCASSSRNSWEWPAHNNWFLPTATEGHILNQKTGFTTPIQDPNYAIAPWDDRIKGYEGVTCASNDQGKLLFFSNGIRAWKADGTLITKDLWAGTECGSVLSGSASNGVMTIRHPLTPNKFYLITIDDHVNQGADVNNKAGICGKGIAYAVIDSNANLVHSSQAIETNITDSKLGYLRTTEDMAATLHANGVDIWITFHPLWSKHIVSYLLTYDGFVTPAVVSGEGLVPYVDILQGPGGLDFTQDGSKLALGASINSASSYVDSKKGYGTINLYDFDNETGILSNRMAIHDSEGNSGSVLNVIFGSENKWLHYSAVSGISGVKLDISSDNEATIRGTKTTSEELSPGGYFNGAAITYQGSLKTSNNVYQDAGLKSRYSSNNMYIPPLESTKIEEVDSLCSLNDTVINLQTNWSCTGISSEAILNLENDSIGYFGAGILPTDSARIYGLFNPSISGEGKHKVIFKSFGARDTINITVSIESCAKNIVKTSSVSKNKHQIYPNPTSGKIWINGGKITSWKLHTVYGKLVQKGNSSFVDLQSYPKGSYLLNTNGTNTIIIRK